MNVPVRTTNIPSRSPLPGIQGEFITMGQLTRNEVFTLAVQRYSDTVYRTAVHNCRNTADAEDVV